VAEILQVPIGVPSLEHIVDQALVAMTDGDRQIVFACANSNSMNVTRQDAEFRAALCDADQVVADGVGVKVVAGLVGKHVGPRIIGQDYFCGVMAACQDRGFGRVFFLGSAPETLERIKRRFQSRYPDLTLCGTLSPPFGEWSEEENEHFIEQINASRPDVLWVGMTAPKQEKWVYRNRSKLEVPVIGSIGAVFDFFAGTVRASPPWVRKLGLEAGYRLAMEPRRLWRRVLVSNVTFVLYGAWHELRSRRRGQLAD